jgi:hypothetical protein
LSQVPPGPNYLSDAPLISAGARVGRACSYQSNEAVGEPGQALEGAPAFNIPSTISVDPYSYASLRLPFLDIAFRDEAHNILGELPEMERFATQFFRGVYNRMPFVSETRFRVHLPYLYARPKADYILLCLSISLILQKPRNVAFDAGTMQSSLYVTVKCLISSFEAASHVTLDFLQARALLCYYELGHGLYPAAAASAASCAASARALGFEKKHFQDRGQDAGDVAKKHAAEEEKRTWWAIVNMDRFIGLCIGDSHFASSDPSLDDLLPIEDTAWVSDVRGPRPKFVQC